MRTHNSRLERRLNLLGNEPLPVDVPREERVVLNVGGSVDSEPVGRIPIEQSDEQRASLGANLLREAKRVLEDLAVHFVGVLVVKGRETRELRDANEARVSTSLSVRRGNRRRTIS